MEPKMEPKIEAKMEPKISPMLLRKSLPFQSRFHCQVESFYLSQICMMPPILVADSGFPLKEGLYEFIHPDVCGVIIPILDNNDFKIELRSFRSLTYNWGTKFANPARDLCKKTCRLFSYQSLYDCLW
jgi:hypothetical protein